MKVGDKVRVKTREEFKKMGSYAEFRNGDIIIDQPNSFMTFNRSMNKYCGEIGTVTLVDSYDEFDLDIDDGDYYWADWMVVKL